MSKTNFKIDFIYSKQCICNYFIHFFNKYTDYNFSRNLTWRELIPYRSGFNGRFMFARFENVTGVVEIGEEQLVEEETNETADNTRAFDNPMYSDVSQLIICVDKNFLI